MKLESKDLLKLPTDKALVDDPAFRKYVELYAKVIVFTMFSFVLYFFFFWYNLLFSILFYTIVLCIFCG